MKKYGKLFVLFAFINLIACNIGNIESQSVNQDETIKQVEVDENKSGWVSYQIQNTKSVLEYDKSVPLDRIDTITFGAENKDGTEKIEWFILEKRNTDQGNIALLLSKYSIGKTQYNESIVNPPPTWETSSLRNFLNVDFLWTAFFYHVGETFDFIDMIVPVKVYNGEQAVISRYGGNDTFDYIFLLSMSEFSTYIEGRQDVITERWWLRTPGNVSPTSILCAVDDQIFHNYYYAQESYENYNEVRPALWIKY